MIDRQLDTQIIEIRNTFASLKLFQTKTVLKLTPLDVLQNILFCYFEDRQYDIEVSTYESQRTPITIWDD